MCGELFEQEAYICCIFKLESLLLGAVRYANRLRGTRQVDDALEPVDPPIAREADALEDDRSGIRDALSILDIKVRLSVPVRVLGSYFKFP